MRRRDLIGPATTVHSLEVRQHFLSLGHMARVSCGALDRSRMSHGRAPARVILDLAATRVEEDVHPVYGTFCVPREDEISLRPKVETDLTPPDW